MKKILKSLLICLCIIFISIPLVSAKDNLPKPTNLKYVNDYTNTLSLDAKEYVVSVGKELEDKTGAQSVVVIVNSLDDNDIQT
ncbi:hypothetical protein KUA25_18310, partial [Bacteroidales bacterium MSK.15.36]|nr:hypothetical protein [Bacteroidales bacterium MSK.15.36]